MSNRDPLTVNRHIEHVKDLIRLSPMEDKIKLREILKSLQQELRSHWEEKYA